MTRYNDGQYECDSEQEADWYEEQTPATAYCFLQITYDGKGGLKAKPRIYTDAHPTVAHMPGYHVLLFSKTGKNTGAALRSCTAGLLDMFPELKVDHG